LSGKGKVSAWAISLKFHPFLNERPQR
jgi:hypothetical protein